MNFSYNISAKLTSYLTRINTLRTEILLTPLSPKTELRLKWDATVERIFWSLALVDNQLSKAEVADLLSKSAFSPQRKLTDFEKDILNQRKTLSYIKEEWNVSENPVTMTTIKKLYEMSCRETLGKMSGLTEFSEKNINLFLDYIQKGHDHPVVQAGIAQIEIINITPFYSGNSRVGRLLSYVFLYKNGFDVRDMISFEEYMRRNIATSKSILDLSKSRENLTLWLEYFAFAIIASLEKTRGLVKNPGFEKTKTAFWKLNSRQVKILEYLEQPEVKITNKEVQKRHNISQITASRDLAKLANSGLLLVHGKGRSVYYTKV